MITLNDYPFPLVTISGDRAEKEILRLRAAINAGNHVAVIIGDKNSALRLVELWNEPFDLAAELKYASEFSAEDWFAERSKEDEEYILDESQSEIHANGVAPMTRLSAGFDHKNQPLAEVFIATLPTLQSPAIPVHLRFGYWNSCPAPHIHMGLARYWGERFGAKIVALTSDTVEYVVARPPETDEQALELAWQQYFYCADIVDQGVGSVATLAQALRRSTRWYFWWD